MTPFDVDVIPYKELAWVYISKVTTNFISSYSLIIVMAQGKTLTINGSKNRCEEILNKLSRMNPTAFFGYDPNFEYQMSQKTSGNAFAKIINGLLRRKFL